LIREADVTGHWVHSHEEDDENGTVYRPVGYKLPRARGRTGFELRQDGTCQYFGIGRGDDPEAIEGTWKLNKEDRPHIRMYFDSGETMDFPIVSANNKKLVVAPV
jgi:hypothetical protein